jgi:hypothetical protein
MTKTKLIFEKQWLHVMLLAVLLAGISVCSDLPAVRAGQFLGITTPVWLWLAVGIAVTHQIYVWLIWRTELHGSLISRTFGKRGFTLYAIGFAVIAISRVIAVFVVAFSNRDSLPVNPAILKIPAIITLMLALYVFYSVRRYFSFRRALGIDHFDKDYSSIPFERRGIFRFTSNGMYTFGFLILWFPALWWSSAAAICVALFNHLYIWIHYYSTELPDIRRIYGRT